MHTSFSSASLPLTLFSLPPWRDDNRINVSLGFRQRTDQIRAGGVETPDWLLYLTECLEEGGAVVMVMGGIKSRRRQRREAQTHLFFLSLFIFCHSFHVHFGEWGGIEAGEVGVGGVSACLSVA